MKRRMIGLVVERSCERQGSVFQQTLPWDATDNRVQSPQTNPPWLGLDERGLLGTPPQQNQKQINKIECKLTGVIFTLEKKRKRRL